MEVKMRRVLLAVALFAGSVGLASAQGVDVDVGRGGVQVGPRHDYDYRYRHRDTYGYGGECRTIVRKTWRNGERVIVRRRVCD
jgi:hypothetical protein